MATLCQIYTFAAITRASTVLLSILSYIVTGSYDTSTEIILPTDPIYSHWRFLNVFVRWDAIYFYHIAKHGYVYEQETAFFPLLPYLTRYLSQTALRPLQYIFGEEYTMIVTGALISNISFVLAAGYLYKLTKLIYPGYVKLATYSAIAFCLSLPSMFMSAFYTESLFALLSFAGMYYVARQSYAVASVIWGIASLARSNAIIYAGFFIYDLIITRFSRVSFKSLLYGTAQAIIYSVVAISGFVAFQYSIYKQYCHQNDVQLSRTWCIQSIPLVYTYVQKEYWGNGFLAYYEIKQIPNFLLALPIIGLSVLGLWEFISKDWTRWLSLGQITHQASSNDTSFTSNRASVFMYLWAFLLAYSVTCMHVQVILRFFTSLPPLYWYIGHLWSQGFTSSSSKKQQWIANAILSYFVLYGLVGVILFSAFLPPA